MNKSSQSRNLAGFRYKSLPFTGLLLAFSSGCALLQPPASNDNQAVEQDVISTQQTDGAESVYGGFGTDISQPMLPEVALRFHILTAEAAIQRGNPGMAAEHFLAASRLSDDVRLVESATRASLAARRYDLALTAVDRWSELDPESRQPRQLALRLHLAAGNVAEVSTLAEALVEGHPEGKDAGLREVAVILSSEQEHAEDALSVMKRLVSRAPTEPAARYALSLMALRLEQFELAQEQADWALRLKPGWHEAALLKSQAQLNQNDMTGAEATMKSQVVKDPKNLEVILSFARQFLDVDAYDLASRAYARVLVIDGKNQEALYALGLLSLEADEVDNGYKYMKRLYDQTIKPSGDNASAIATRNSEAAFYLGRIEEQRKSWKKAADWYERVRQGDQVFEARSRRAYMLYKKGDLPAARRYLAELRSTYSAQALELHMTEAEILYDARDYPAAMAQYDKALEQFPGDPDLLYGRTLILTELDQVDKAIADLRTLVEQQPDDARSLNALGYILTNYSDNYEEALGYIEKALALTPDDAAVIDSMGWVQYRMGHLNSALSFLEDAWERHQDPEIAAHLGEVLWKLGQRHRAAQVWKQGLDDDPEHPILNETMTRLKR